MNTSIISVPFHNDTLTATLVDNVPYVAIKPICEKLGLDWASQFTKIKKHPILSKGVVMITTPSKGGLQEMLMLPIRMINGWLFGIDSRRVKEEARESVLLYQEKCFDVLADYFMPKAKYGLFDQLEIPDMPKPAIAPCHPTMMNAKMKNHIQHVIDLTAQKYSTTTNAIVRDLATFFRADNWELIPMTSYPDVCAYFNIEPRFRVDCRDNWVMVDAASLEFKTSVDVSVKLDTLQKELQQLNRDNEPVDKKMIRDAVLKISDALDVLAFHA